MSCRSATKIYKVPESTLRDRMTSRTPRRELKANRHMMTEVDEEVLIRYILDLDARGFAPCLADVEDMTNYLTHESQLQRGPTR